VRWESFGGNGTSGTLQCVVNEPASEHEPRTELYIADTLTQQITKIQTMVLCNICKIPGSAKLENGT